MVEQCCEMYLWLCYRLFPSWSKDVKDRHEGKGEGVRSRVKFCSFTAQCANSWSIKAAD